MGHKHSKTADSCAQGDTAFKLFEYQCTTCRSKRPIQYFYKNGKFLPQTPRVVCGECNTSVAVEPFKTVEYGCPSCKRWQKARLPARPIPLNMYNVSVVSCNCGFKGEVNVGRLMDVACCQCWQHRRELCDVWLEDGDELRHYCGNCKDERRCIAQVPKKKGTEPAEDLEYAWDETNGTSPRPRQCMGDADIGGLLAEATNARTCGPCTRRSCCATKGWHVARRAIGSATQKSIPGATSRSWAYSAKPHAEAAGRRRSRDPAGRAKRSSRSPMLWHFRCRRWSPDLLAGLFGPAA
mmetsp:Transcript_17177/g.55505  ORF Transcript_17177/g.55505 Transcript_17177/m.55505 type:complete len:295 (+) Transcript_17177:95-979(+)